MEQHHYKGLTTEEINDSRRAHGANKLTPPAKEPLWRQFIEKFEDPIIRILLVALLLSVGIAVAEYAQSEVGLRVFLEPLGILIAILLATCIGFWFEVKANRAFEVLNQVNDEEPVRVIRNGEVTEAPKCDIVVGDIVLLNTGDEAPADGVLREAVSLQMNESTLTGEPSTHKYREPQPDNHEATYPVNKVMRGTTVIDGHGVMQVERVGDATEYGKVYTAAQIDNSIKTPLNRQLDGLGAMITKVSYLLAALIMVGRLIMYFTHGHPLDGWHLMSYLLASVMIAVTLIVVAVPEGLPMSVTLSLALSMRRMLKSQNLVRKMHACETMGATTVICTDKTGTLTQNQMRVYDTRFTASEELMAEAIAVNTTAYLEHTPAGSWRVLGNPTEGALLLALADKQLSYEALREASPVLDQLTFSTERKYMATVVQSAATGKRVLYVKGAPEIVLTHCTALPTLQEIENQLATYQSQAMRTLGFAYCILEADEVPFHKGRLTLNNLTFMGIAAISDPIRQDVPEAVQLCQNAGISIKIVTGDTPATAREIGRQIGLWQPADTAENEITGIEFAALSDEELLTRVKQLKIMSRARPMDKQRLVDLLQQTGEVVAVTGDGTNDAPALNKAQVGLSMGDGTAVAKEASDITILDNSFASIGRAVMWGRSLYRNIQRFILFQMTVNVAACLIVLLGAFMGTESPLTVSQMLWVNLIMDTFAAMALASLPPSPDVMSEHPRARNAFIITRHMRVGILLTGCLFVLAMWGVLELFRHVDFSTLSALLQGHYRVHASAELTRYELSLFFTFFVFLQFWNLFNAKAFATAGSALKQLCSERSFLLVAVIILAGQLLIVSFGGEMFTTTPLFASDWLILLAVTSVVLWVGEIKRAIR